MQGQLGRRAFGGMVLASVAGCSAAVGVGESNKDSSYQKKITRVLVTTALRAPDLSDRQNEGFVRASEISQSLAAAWGPLGVTFEVVDLNSGQGTAEAIARFAPLQILSLTLKGYQLYKFVVDAYDVDVSLLDVPTNRRIYRTTLNILGFAQSGRMRHSGLGGAISHQNDANDLVAVLTPKLKADGLL
ncbi:hypothetical protein BH11PSE3_BH11PSE3_33470 [soil metagenome]